MKRLSIICLLVIMFAVGIARAQQYEVAPCGTKDFTTTAGVVPGAIICLDIYLTGVGVGQDVGDVWIDFTSSTADIVYVRGGRCLLDGREGCTGPWDPNTGAFINEPEGPGTILYVVANLAGPAPDEDGDLILGTVTLQNNGSNDATVNIEPIAISVWQPLDPEDIVSGEIVISQVNDCTTDIDCDDGLFCNGTESCIEGECSSHSGNPCVGGSECNATCHEVGRNCYAPPGTLCTNGICNGEGICFTPSTYYVDGNVLTSGNGTSWEEAFKTIQEGINSALNGDTVLVADGVYTGIGNINLDYGGKKITVQSVNGPENCVIDCENIGRGFYFNADETSDSVVKGFKIVNGYAGGSTYDGYGGGIVLHSSPTITNCIFEGNWGKRGGGACVYHAHPTITDSVFIDNSSEYGGGIQVLGGSPKIINCIISGNTATLYGGGISSGSATIKNCIISGNTAGVVGGGVWSKYTGSVMNIVNSTIVSNLAGYGGGIYCSHYSTSFIRNSILWNNTAVNGPQIAVNDLADWRSWPASLTVNYSLVQGGQGAVYVRPRYILYWGEGNIDEDPLFVDPDGFDDIIGTEDDDLHLQLASPCVDAGTPFSDYSNEPEPKGCLINIGAYGNTSEATLSSDSDSDGDGVYSLCDDCTDTDSDGYGNPGFPNNICSVDNCPDLVNVDQIDSDQDGMGNACDDCPYDPDNDIDNDDVCGDIDNCPITPNLDQTDTYPPQGNGIGDACECEADFDCNGDVDALDIINFLWDFGRGAYDDPCSNDRWCYGDFDCNGAVDAEDVSKLLEDFGRGQYFNPCPQCTGDPWCNY